VKAQAAALGFDACGIAEAEDVDPEDRLGAWLAAGRHAGMTWMARTKQVRQDPRLKVPGARSVIVVARNYYAARPEPPDGCGRVSRYAWGRDYHRVLRKPLRALAGFLSTLDAGAQSYCCVDTGPVLERAWAARAGIGWIGKNGLVLRRDLGSWLFLGVIVTTIELAADPPVADRCGACTRCIEACPTQAIVAPGIVDSRRCIAYHTIENAGEVPSELRTHFGNWVFGCDVCQEVCPWNRFARKSTEKDFFPRAGHANPDLTAFEEMDEDRFNQRFAGSPLRRAGFGVMRRNVQIARQNMHNRAPFRHEEATAAEVRPERHGSPRTATED